MLKMTPKGPEMASVRLIRVSSRRTGERQVVRVYVYDDLAEMQKAGARFSANGETFEDAHGLCQAYTVSQKVDDEWVTVYRSPVVVRLWREKLGARVVVHEMSHAATEIYARSVDTSEPAAEHLHNGNETMAYLHGDLTAQLVDRLHALGYYSKPS